MQVDYAYTVQRGRFDAFYASSAYAAAGSSGSALKLDVFSGKPGF